jgi:hypothetical protein
MIGNWPAIIGVSGTFVSTPGPTNVYTSGLQGISGTVAVSNQPGLNVYTSGLQGISGSVSAAITNWPAVIGVSGSLSAGASLGTNIYTSGPQAVSGSVSVSGAVSLSIPSFTGSLGVSSLTAKATSGQLLSVSATNRSTNAVWIQLFNATSVIGIPVAQFPVGAMVNGFAGLTAIGTDVWTSAGVTFSTGITVGISSTSITYTADTATNHDITVVYK